MPTTVTIDGKEYQRAFDSGLYPINEDFSNTDGVKKVPISNSADRVADEIHFYKESKDGAFTTSKANTFVLYENELYLLYQCDFSNDKAPVMLIKPLPPVIGNYFCSVVENLKSE